jgi:hypothetical protein
MGFSVRFVIMGGTLRSHRCGRFPSASLPPLTQARPVWPDGGVEVASSRPGMTASPGRPSSHGSRRQVTVKVTGPARIAPSRRGTSPPWLALQIPQPLKDGAEPFQRGMESSMDNLAWVIVAMGVGMGGLVMIFGHRKADTKLAPDRIKGAVKQDADREYRLPWRDPRALSSSAAQALGRRGQNNGNSGWPACRRVALASRNH